MPVRAGLVKPFAAAWRARAYFAFAFIFWLLYSSIQPPFAAVQAKQWWQDLIDKAVGSFDKIAYLVAIAGLVYAVISDVIDYVWANSLQSEAQRALSETQKAFGDARSDLQKGMAETGEILRTSLANFTAGLVAMTFESVKVWIESGYGRRRQSGGHSLRHSTILYAKLRFRALGTSGSLSEATFLLEAHRLAIFAGIRSRYVAAIDSAYQLSAPKAEGRIRGFAYDLMSAARQLCRDFVRDASLDSDLSFRHVAPSRRVHRGLHILAPKLRPHYHLNMSLCLHWAAHNSERH